MSVLTDRASTISVEPTVNGSFNDVDRPPIDDDAAEGGYRAESAGTPMPPFML